MRCFVSCEADDELLFGSIKIFFCSEIELKFGNNRKEYYICTLFFNEGTEMVDVAQLVRATDCGSVGRGFETIFHPRS